jgi:hypothetical protein
MVIGIFLAIVGSVVIGLLVRARRCHKKVAVRSGGGGKARIRTGSRGSGSVGGSGDSSWWVAGADGGSSSGGHHSGGHHSCGGGHSCGGHSSCGGGGCGGGS